MLIGSIKPLQAPYLKSFLFGVLTQARSYLRNRIRGVIIRVPKLDFNQHRKAAKASQRHSPLILIPPPTHVLHWDSVPRVLNPPTPFSRERSGPSCAPERRATASLFFGRHLMTYLNPPNPLFKGAIRASGLSIASWLPLPANSGPASDDALFGTRGRRLRSRRAWSSRRLLVAGA